MKKLLVLALVTIIAVLSSCKKDELAPKTEPTPTTAYTFKQTAYMWQDAYEDQTGKHAVFTYRVAVMADVHMDSVTINLTVVLNDSTKITLNGNDLENFGQVGCSAPNYQYPVYWVATLTGTKGICQPFYNFTQSDVYRFEYEAKVKIRGIWYTVPKGERKVNDPFESFWI
ncbi:MAG: hypothetical protein NTX91_00370 [candidate division SR1 bacterium]|nr:hypothetical protein [candidate division SR1 bacterium]